ncbi:MAG: DUF2157 domain-containing protein [Magnetococcus sp. THC-1_WYH]
MANDRRRLQKWVANGLISADQAEAILAFEETGSRKNWLLYGFMSLGAWVMGTGIISLVSANWYEIPDAVKLGADLIILLGIAYGIIKQQGNEHSLAWESMLSFFSLACLTSIGLIGQIYHTSGGWDLAVLLWAVIILPVITLTHRTFLPSLWVFAVIAAGSSRLAMTPFWGFDETQRILLIGYALPLACALVAVLLRFWPPAEMFARPLRTWAWYLGIGTIMVIDGTTMTGDTPFQWSATMTWTGIALGGAVLAGIALRPHLPTPAKLLLGLLVALYTGTAPIIIIFKLSHWFSAFFTMALFAVAATWLVREHALRLANTLILLLGFRFLLLFFTAFGGLMDAGIGLIISGMTILGCVWALSRLQKWLLGWVERLAP